MGIILSSFVGCGREFIKNTHGDKVKIFDAVKDVQIDENDNDSIDSYFNVVMSQVNDNDIVFIGFSEKIRNKFNENNIDYDVFYPDKNRRREFIENQVRKRARPNDIRDIDKNFEKWVDDIENDESPNCYKHKLANQGEFIGNNAIIMQYINSLKPKQQEVNTNNEATQNVENNE